jgi:putative flippase GtrA
MVRIALLYTVFALLAMVANIGAQHVCVVLYHGVGALPFSIGVGTAAGLVIKYLLDKKYIFNFKAKNLQQDSKVFALYTIMGLLTTAIFWGTEWMFHVLFSTDLMRYVGAVLGLSVGYIIKYQLDKKYVFKQSESTCSV